MADTVTSKVIFAGKKRYIVNLTCVSDGTGETAVAKVTLSALATALGFTPTYTVVDMIDYYIQGFSSVKLYWDHTTDDTLAILPPGSGTLDWNAAGGNVDPKSAGGPGNIILTSAGPASGATYDLTLYIRPKV